MKRLSAILLALLLSLGLIFTGCDSGSLSDGGSFIDPSDEREESVSDSKTDFEAKESDSESGSELIGSIQDIPPYSGSPYIQLNGGQPEFTESDLKTKSYETYSPLDSLGRCGVTIACIGTDIMPTEPREPIGSVTPSGWVNNRYDTELVSGGYIYNRSHLIGFQLTGENANERNLITGTRYFNVEGMLPFENMVADYLKEEPENHVMYRVTPIYEGNNLVASGVQIEAFSVEDDGEGICFNVYIYNVQPGIVIDYATGNNWLDTENPPAETESGSVSGESGETATYILNTSSKKFHKPSCSSASSIQENNREEYTGDKEELLSDGYTACGICKP